MGMTYEQFWEQSPYLVIAYRKAYKLKREIANEQAWLQGIYIYDAFAVVMKNAFSKSGARKETYFEKPLDIMPLSEDEKKRRGQEERAKMQKAMEAIASKQRSKKKQG